MAFFKGRKPEVIKRWNENTFLVKDLGVLYVCKQIRPDDLDLYRRLMTVDCPQIARIYDTAIVDGKFCVVQEYLDGVTLEEYLQKKGPQDEFTAAGMAFEICEALIVLHEKGIIHRDLTPKNLIITEAGQLKVIDFGISRVEKTDAATDTEFLGTAGFAAPEQYGFHQSSAQTDIYSVGVLLNYIRTLKFPTEELAEGNLRPVIEKCTKMDAADRYQSAGELKEALLSVGRTEKTKKREPRKKEYVNALPGFRKNIWWHKIIAGFYYVTVFIIMLSSFWIHYDNAINRIALPIGFFLFYVAPVPILFNTGDWLEKFPLTRGRSRFFQVCVQGILLIIDLLLLRAVFPIDQFQNL